MKIAIISPDLSHNSLGRAYLLAKILHRKYEIEIVGPFFGDAIWPPVAEDTTICYKSTKLQHELHPSLTSRATMAFTPYKRLNSLAKKIEADVIYASKPLFTSFGLGLLKKLQRHVPVVLDIDDWQTGLLVSSRKYDSATAGAYSTLRGAYGELRVFGSFLTSALRMYDYSSLFNAEIGEKLAPLANKITVSNTFLQEKFGGEVIYHGRDTNAFDPCRFDRQDLRLQFKIDDNDQIIMFLGSPRPYKGISDLIQAVALNKRSNAKLFLVGLNNKEPYSAHMAYLAKQELGERFRGFGQIPFTRVPEFLAVADLVVIPQRREAASIGQLPAKVFDAMAMAKPVIATNVNDLPIVLEGCGWVVEPGDPSRLAEAILHVLSNPNEADKRGAVARKRCVEKYSWDALERQLVGLFEEYA